MMKIAQFILKAVIFAIGSAAIIGGFWLLYLFVRIAAAGPAGMVACDPVYVYSNNFDLPITEISGLKGGGYYLQGGDLWLRFNSPKPVRPREAATFAEISPKEAGAYFILLSSRTGSPADLKILNTAEDMRCLYRNEKPEGSGREHFFWLLYSEKNQAYFARLWTKG